MEKAKMYADELIPSSVGTGAVRKYFQSRTLYAWSALTVAGLSSFYQPYVEVSPQARAASLGLLFPGAGFIASGTITGGALFLLTILLLPVTLFAWFGAGAVAFPLALWILSGVAAYFVAGGSVFQHAGIVAIALLGAVCLYLNRGAAKARNTAATKRSDRNNFIPKTLEEIDRICAPRPKDEDRELSLEELRAVQHVIDLGLLDIDDWSEFGVIDQFQTSALRYQLYEMMYTYGIYQGTYTPNFHGYLSQAFRNTIEKSFTKKVMNFWKWESLLGKFTTDYDPVARDNIMVSGFLLQGMMLYISNTGDKRYEKPLSMKFHITNDIFYEHSIHSMDEAMVKQWKENPYCLFPCEPNWIYTPCNFQGAIGQAVYDRYYGTKHLSSFIGKFEESLMENFAEGDGSIVPIRSAATGFTIPGLCGALSDLTNALFCRGYLDHISRRMWAIFRHENVDFDEKTGRVQLKGLVGADKMDPGNYKGSEFCIYSMVSFVAGEHGDEKLRLAVIKLLKEKVGITTTSTGATKLSPELASHSFNTSFVKGNLLRSGDWKRLIMEGPSKEALNGPVLSTVPYPGVLVAKARSNTSKDLNCVFYPSGPDGTFVLGIERLTPGGEYLLNGTRIVATDRGELKVKLDVSGRTEMNLQPQKQ